MKRVLWGSLLILLLAACGTTKPELPQATDTFSFTVDPAAQSVKLTSVTAGALAVQVEEGRRVLVPGEDLALRLFEFTFLPGNILKISSRFENVSACNFSDLSFRARSSNVVSSTEPTVTDADLGGDGVLEPNEYFGPLQFQVDHKGQTFTYEVQAEATVNCPPVPVADLSVSVDIPKAVVTLGETITYNVLVSNKGPDTARKVILTAETAETAQLILTGEALQNQCAYDNGSGSAFNQKLACAVGTLAPGEKRNFTFLANTLSLGKVDQVFEVTPYQGDPDSGNNGVSGDNITVLAADCSGSVSIPDRYLELSIRAELHEPEGDITCPDIAMLTELTVGNFEGGEGDVVNNLEGIQFATNLTRFEFSISMSETNTKYTQLEKVG